MAKKYRYLALLLLPLVAVAYGRPAAGLLVDLASHWSSPLVSALEAKGVISGDALGRFRAEEPLTRAEMAKLLVTTLGNEEDAKLLAQYDSRFRDVPRWHWAKGYVESLAETGVTDGYPDGGFAPGERVTRAQMAVFLVRAAGLSDQARLQRLEPTAYDDDAAVPDWARGAVNVATKAGLITGFEDHTLRPNQTITRAQGAAVVLRLMEYRGNAFHLVGTLTAFDPQTGQGRVRDAAGQERAFTMANDAVYYRGGFPATRALVRRFDQVWIVLGPAGEGRFLEARYSDLVGTAPQVTGGSVTVTLGTGKARTLPLQPGALVYVNGRPAAAAQASGADEAYLVLDQLSGDVRVLDVVRTPVRGQLIGLTPDGKGLVLDERGSVKTLPVAPDLLVLVEGERVSLTALRPGKQLRLAVNEAGQVTYLQAER